MSRRLALATLLAMLASSALGPRSAAAAVPSQLKVTPQFGHSGPDLLGREMGRLEMVGYDWDRTAAVRFGLDMRHEYTHAHTKSRE